MSRRRTLATLLALCAAPYARAQSTKPKRVIILSAGSPGADDPAAFFNQLRRLGWIEGRNISFERVYAQGSRAKMTELAQAAAAKNPDLIYAPTGFAAGSAVKATKSIPVVFSTVSDPVNTGLVVSLARPGANATGTFQIQGDLTMKRFEMIREALPRATRVGALLDAKATDFEQQRQRHVEAGSAFGFALSFGEFSTFDEAAAVISRFASDGVQVATCASSFTIISRRTELVEHTRRARMPLIAHRVEWAEAGAVLSYGADVNEALRRSAEITHRILNGARPADTPVEQASKFELIVNLASARQLGISLPKAFVARADRVIE